MREVFPLIEDKDLGLLEFECSFKISKANKRLFVKKNRGEGTQHERYKEIKRIFRG